MRREASQRGIRLLKRFIQMIHPRVITIKFYLEAVMKRRYVIMRCRYL